MQFPTIILNALVLAFASTSNAGPIQERSILTLQKDLLIKGVTSYSAIVKMTTKATTAEIVKFGSAAWHQTQSTGSGAPGAAIALQPKGDPEMLYIASSIKGGAGKYWTHLQEIAAEQGTEPGQLLKVIEACEAATGAAHRTGAACAEANVLDLILAANPHIKSFSQLFQYVKGAEFVPIVDAAVAPPCSGGDNNCEVLVVETLQMTPIKSGTVSATDTESLGSFTIEKNPRAVDK